MASVQETPAVPAQAFWKEAKRLRQKIIHDIDGLKKGTGGKTEEEQLRTLEEGMAQFRLRFVLTISQDPQYTFEQDAEEVMWKLHIFVNQTYRDLIYGALKGQQHVVTKRKVEKLYNIYLKTALGFYKGYFQRLEALHGMPQIPRINRLLELQAPRVDESQGTSFPADAVEKSFHSTLLHLGDISRWRHKARPRPDGLKTAVLFYELANDLRPTHGAAHHQLGILEDDNHLHIVYHLYRARAIETPHPNAIPNLEQEFKKLLQSSTPGRRSGPPDPDEAFANWFTKLHARLYKGDEFPQELEEEVLHRLETTLKKPDALPLILKMVLVNIAAYWVAKSKIGKEWSLKASASCQFILRLNVRWILAVSRHLQSELEEFIKAAPPVENESPKSGEDENPKDTREFSAFTDTVLPLTRIYMAWLYVYRNDIVDYQQHLGPYVFDMYRALAQTLTMVAKEFTGKSMAPSPYLLAEDVVALGMKPFDDTTLPAMCRLQHQSDKDNFKPHWEDSGLPKNSAEQEMMSRIYDLMGCGLSLAFDQRFPLGVKSPLSDGSGGALSVLYIEGGKPSVPVQVPVASNLQPTSQNIEQLRGQFHGLNSSEEGHANQHVSGGDKAGGQAANVRASSDLGHHRAGSGPGVIHESNTVHNHLTEHDVAESESDLSLEARMVDMVDNLLEDDNSDFGVQAKPGSVAAPGGLSSYGMHSVTEKVFGNVLAQRHDIAGAFDEASPTVPWEPFADASRSGAPRGSATATPQQGSTAGVNTNSPGHMPGGSRTSTLIPSAPAFTPGSRPQSGSDEHASFSAGHVAPFGNPLFAQNSLASGRPSSGLSASARGNFGHSKQRLGGSTDSSGVSPFLSPKGDARSHLVAAGSQNVDEKGKKTASPDFAWGNSSFSTTFAQNSSGLPSVSSPFGLPAANVFAQRDPFSNYQTYGAPMSSMSQYQQPNDFSTVNNGNVYDATTAYGRGDIATKEDPTYYRNAVRGTAMATAVAQADSYDRAIFKSALADGPPKPKR